MTRFVNITRWDPQTARALRERWNAVINGTAPQAVLDAFAKIKWITQDISLPNRLSVMVYEVEEKDLLATVPLSLYMQDVCMQEEYLSATMEDFLAASEKLPPETIPKPESWTK